MELIGGGVEETSNVTRHKLQENMGMDHPPPVYLEACL